MGNGVRGSKGIGAAEAAVGDYITSISATIERFTNHLSRLGETHGNDRNGGTRELLLEAKCLLECIEVIGIEDCRKSSTIDGAFGSHGVRTHVAGVWYLLGKYDNL